MHPLYENDIWAFIIVLYIYCPADQRGLYYTSFIFGYAKVSCCCQAIGASTEPIFHKGIDSLSQEY